MSLNCCIVDVDLKAADELAVLLEKIDQAGHISIAENIPQAMDILLKIKTDLLFIRIVTWDEYRIVAPLLPERPGQVVFLSGRREHCTSNLSIEVDFHLKPPYLEGRVRRVFDRLLTPGFQSRNLEFFFLRVDCHFYAVPFSSVEWIKRNGTNLIVKTHDRQYEVAGSLEKMQARLPIQLERVSWGMLVASGKNPSELPNEFGVVPPHSPIVFPGT
jgi:DNA-binding LytR/AlgR family response regulator